jgi:hypothetical protein
MDDNRIPMKVSKMKMINWVKRPSKRRHTKESREREDRDTRGVLIR